MAPHSPTSEPSPAKKLWDKAWGKPWPHQSSGNVSIQELSSDADVPMSIETDEDNIAVSPNSTSWQYTCLHRIHEVVAACLGDSGIVQDVLVIRPEYVWLRETIETGYLRRDKAIVVMGHPGIGW